MQSGAPVHTGTFSARKKPVRQWARFRFRITAEGVMLLLVVILVGFAAWHSGTNLLYLIFSLLISMYLLHGFSMSLNLARLSVSETLPETVIAGEPFELTVSLSNKKRFFGSRGIRVSYATTHWRRPVGSVYFITIPRLGSQDLSFTLTAPSRGIFRLESAAISTQYPLGFEERSQIYQISREILVLPATWPVGSVALKIPKGFGDQESEVRGAGADLYGLRDYVEGEPVRHVHWRTSARAQKLIIAEYTREERRQVMLVLNNGIDSKRHLEVSESFENAVILAASMARHLNDEGFEVGLITLDRVMAPRQGMAHVTEMLRHLALIQLQEPGELKIPDHAVEITFTPGQRRGSATSIVIESSGWTPPAVEHSRGVVRV